MNLDNNKNKGLKTEVLNNSNLCSSSFQSFMENIVKYKKIMNEIIDEQSKIDHMISMNTGENDENMGLLKKSTRQKNERLKNLKTILERLIIHNQQIVEYIIEDSIAWKKKTLLEMFSRLSTDNLLNFNTNPNNCTPITQVKWPQESTLSSSRNSTPLSNETSNPNPSDDDDENNFNASIFQNDPFLLNTDTFDEDNGNENDYNHESDEE